MSIGSEAASCKYDENNACWNTECGVLLMAYAWPARRDHRNSSRVELLTTSTSSSSSYQSFLRLSFLLFSLSFISRRRLSSALARFRTRSFCASLVWPRIRLRPDATIVS